MERLTTPWSGQMGLDAPILNAPMGGAAGGRLATAVSAAGGLGMIGVGSEGSRELIEQEAGYVHSAGLPFGIGLLDWALRREPALLETALAASPRLISVSFGDEWAWIDRVRSEGVVTATQICTTAEAQRAQDAGIDVIVARGAEGGGHGDPRIGTLTLLEGVLDAVSVPVLAAGGISSPEGWLPFLPPAHQGSGWVPPSLRAPSRSPPVLPERRCCRQRRPTPSSPESSTSPSATDGRQGIPSASLPTPCLTNGSGWSVM